MKISRTLILSLVLTSFSCLKQERTSFESGSSTSEYENNKTLWDKSDQYGDEFDRLERELEDECNVQFVYYSSSPDTANVYMKQSWLKYGHLDQTELKKIEKCRKLIESFTAYCDSAQSYSKMSEHYDDRAKMLSKLSKMAAEFLKHRPKGNKPAKTEKDLLDYKIEFKNGMVYAPSDITGVKSIDQTWLDRIPSILLLLQNFRAGLSEAGNPLKKIKGMEEYKKALRNRSELATMMTKFFKARANRKVQRLVEIHEELTRFRVTFRAHWEKEGSTRKYLSEWNVRRQRLEEYDKIIPLLEEFIEVGTSEELFAPGAAYDKKFGLVLKAAIDSADELLKNYQYWKIRDEYDAALTELNRQGVSIFKTGHTTPPRQDLNKDWTGTWLKLRAPENPSEETKEKIVRVARDFVKKARAFRRTKHPFREDGPREKEIKQYAKHYIDFLEGFTDTDGKWQRGLISIYSF